MSTYSGQVDVVAYQTFYLHWIGSKSFFSSYIPVLFFKYQSTGLVGGWGMLFLWLNVTGLLFEYPLKCLTKYLYLYILFILLPLLFPSQILFITIILLSTILPVSESKIFVNDQTITNSHILWHGTKVLICYLRRKSPIYPWLFSILWFFRVFCLVIWSTYQQSLKTGCKKSDFPGLNHKSPLVAIISDFIYMFFQIFLPSFSLTHSDWPGLLYAYLSLGFTFFSSFRISKFLHLFYIFIKIINLY